ncbi:MAG: hypothetical protein FWG11_02220 [Promicromonosporaceae bacterium]|nr:hypothetical protein [Promicromonosporaceae bacterium]
MLALLDTLSHPARALLRSLELAGIEAAPVLLNYQGDLPAGVRNPFADLTGLPRTGRPLFFNEVPTPPLTEIRQARQAWAEVLRGEATVGRIHYSPGGFRQVERVDWLLPVGASNGTVSRCDRYDAFGNRYAVTHYVDDRPYQTVYGGPGPWEITAHRTAEGREGGLTARSADALLAFGTLSGFVAFYLEREGLLTEGEWLIDSLSTPLFVAREQAGARPHVTLFWQEPMEGEVPGNMAMELESPRALRRIVFSDEAVLAKVRAAFPATAVELAYLSPLEQFLEHRDYDPRRAFTLTMTDDLPALPGLLAALPEVTFVVAAPTLMSDRLHHLAREHRNLELLPTASQQEILAELRRASVYLDVNAGPHVSDVVTTAYHLGLVVLADAAQAKDPASSLSCAERAALAGRLREVTGSRAGRAAALAELQTQAGPQSTVDDYRRLLGA